ncbi:MAG: D-glycero-beta-D-manno-heptose 1-phosphate adenylyltransferase [bacterium]
MKKVDDSSLNKLVKNLKEQNKTIVFTNGCFDILHAGHIDYMEKAKTLGDVLIVGVNSDESVKRIKGSKRPIVKQEYRLRLLEGISSIDYLVVFEEDTPLALIEKLRPDILVKGADWKDKGVVGEDFVKTYGGKVKLIDLLPGISTSIVIENILKAYK